MGLKYQKAKYNCAFTIAFEVPHCDTEDGCELTDIDFAIAINRRVANLLENGELVEAAGGAFDAYEE